MKYFDCWNCRPPKTYPEGTGLDVYSAKTLTEAYNEAKKPSELEGYYQLLL